MKKGNITKVSITKKIYNRGLLGKALLLMSYIILGTVGVYVLLLVLQYYGAPEEIISDVAGIGEVVTAVVAAVMIIYQLDQDRMIEQKENHIQEANFIVQCNQMFMENEKLQCVQEELTREFMGNGTLRENWKEDKLQNCVNYLVYLEGISPLILGEIMHLDKIDNLFAYRYFTAVNNPTLQNNNLAPYDNFYKGCFLIYKKWKNYRLNKYSVAPYFETYRNIIPMAHFELDRLDCFYKYTDTMENAKNVCRQLKWTRNVKMNKIFEIANLIYDTDPYIYPAMFESRVDAIEMITELILSKKDTMFSLDNLFVIEDEDDIKGIILWKKGPILWSRSLFRKIAKDRNIIVSEHFEYVCDNYFKLYEDESLNDRISLINVCVGKEYRKRGIGKAMMAAFVKKHMHEKMELCVLKENQDAVKLYQRFGFEVIGERKGFSIGEEKPDVLEMIRKGGKEDK